MADLVVPLVFEQLLRRIDLTDAVLRHVDLDRIIADVDLDAVAARLDIDAVAARLDIDAVAARLDVDAVAARLDIDGVAARLDIDGVAARLDLAALVPAALAQLDLVAIAQEIIEAVDLPEIIRDSSGALTSDTVQGARIRSAAADQAVGRVRDRFLSRRNGRRLQGQWSGPGDVLPGTTAGPPELPTAPAPEHP